MLQIHVAKWGNSLGFRIPRGIAERMRITAGDTLELTPSEDGLLVKKAMHRGKHYVLSDILDSFTSSETHAEVDFGSAQGQEIW